MPRFLNSTPVRLALALLGITLFAILVYRAGAADLLENIRTLGRGLILIIALGGVAHIVKTAAWRITLLDEKRHVPFARLFGLRLASEAAGLLGLVGQAFGESLRVSFLGSKIPVASRIASVALDRAFFIVSTTTVTIAGLIALLVSVPMPRKLAVCAGLFACVLLTGIILAAVAVRNRWGVLSGTTKALGRLPFLGQWLKPGTIVQSVEHELLEFWHGLPGMFCLSLSLNILCQFLAILELYLALDLMGFHVGLAAALAAEALTKLTNTLGALTPGNVGLYEGGNMLIAKLFGISGAAGLAVALSRRCRAIFWAIVGGLWFVLSKRNRTRIASNDTTPVSTSHGPVAVILASYENPHPQAGSPLTLVHGLPVLLRAILRARKAGASRILVASDVVSASWQKHSLMSTGRIPGGVEFVELGPGESAISSLFSRLADQEQGRLVIIDGGCIYHPCLYRLLAEWKGDKDALTVTCCGEPVGIYALSAELTAELGRQVPPEIVDHSELHRALTTRFSFECIEIEPDKWHRVLPQDQETAEQKLDRWVIKDTDGVFARLNRKVSIPISHQLIKFPVTPNMVSIFTLGVSVLAGLFYTCGDYWNMLLAAALSLFASILDGSDGEVARFKLLESDFGCWLETICDYLYYLLIYGGMAIGLARSSGDTVYLHLCGLFFFGAIATFIIALIQRQRLTNGHPEQLLEIWQKKAENRPTNLLLYIGRRLEFLIRRCFLPYALLVFAAFNITHVAFFLSVVGVNAAWVISLYSLLSFTPVKAPQRLGTRPAGQVPKMPEARVGI